MYFGDFIDFEPIAGWTAGWTPSQATPRSQRWSDKHPAPPAPNRRIARGVRIETDRGFINSTALTQPLVPPAVRMPLPPSPGRDPRRGLSAAPGQPEGPDALLGDISDFGPAAVATGSGVLLLVLGALAYYFLVGQRG